MKILLTIEDISIFGGAERVVVNLANALSEQGHEVEVLSFYQGNKNLPYATNPSVKLHFWYDYEQTLAQVEAKKHFFKRFYDKNFHKLVLSYKLKKRTYELVIASCWVFFPYFKNPKTRYTKLIHRNFHRYNSRNALFDALVILSHAEFSIWQGYHNFVRVIPNFLPQIPSLNTTYSQKAILSVGRMDKGDQKGFFRLLDIWKIVQESIKNPPYSVILSETKCSEVSIQKTENRLLNVECQNENCVDFFAAATPCNPLGRCAQNDKIKVSQNDKSLDLRNDDNLTQWKLIIVGDGVLKKELESKIKALNLQESVILKPFTKQIEKEYLSASIYAMSSHFEGFPMVLLESASYGLAPISFDIKTGPSDIIADEKSGFLVADNDLQGYADKLMLLMCDENLRQNFGTKAKQVVSEKFSKEVVMKEWQGLFDELGVNQ